MKLMFFVFLSAAVTDWKYGKIFHWQILSGIAAGLIRIVFLNLSSFPPFSGMLWGAFGFMVRGFAICAIFYVLYLCRMLGAGDIKLMALCAAILGMEDGLIIIFSGFLLAAVNGACTLIKEGLLWEKMARISRFMIQWGYDGKLREYPGRTEKSSRIYMGPYLFAGYCIWLLQVWAM